MAEMQAGRQVTGLGQQVRMREADQLQAYSVMRRAAAKRRRTQGFGCAPLRTVIAAQGVGILRNCTVRALPLAPQVPQLFARHPVIENKVDDPEHLQAKTHTATAALP